MAAAEALGVLEEPIAVGPLIVALCDKEKNVGMAAALALGRLKVSQGLTPLGKRLLDRMRLFAKMPVMPGEFRNGPATEMLAKALEDEKPRVRYSAVKALGKSQDPQVLQPLINAVSDYHK